MLIGLRLVFSSLLGTFLFNRSGFGSFMSCFVSGLLLRSFGSGLVFCRFMSGVRLLLARCLASTARCRFHLYWCRTSVAGVHFLVTAVAVRFLVTGVAA